MEDLKMKGYKGMVQWFKGGEMVGQKEFDNKDALRDFACKLGNCTIKIEETCAI
jgi:hypothetical protein